MNRLEQAVHWARTYLAIWRPQKLTDDIVAAQVILNFAPVVQAAKHLVWILEQPVPPPGNELSGARSKALLMACGRVRDAVEVFEDHILSEGNSTPYREEMPL